MTRMHFVPVIALQKTYCLMGWGMKGGKIVRCSLDEEVLRGGLREGHLLEVAGEPGAGKSQLAMQVPWCPLWAAYLSLLPALP
jgi:hypothetical protein